MEIKQIYITEFDMQRLSTIVEEAHHIYARDQKYLEDLQNELFDCIVIAPSEVPPNVITMNSEFSVQEVESGKVVKYMLVFPERANISEKKISVLAPIGTALLGCRVGDLVEWKAPSGMKTVKIVEIHYQPEAVGDYHI